MTYKNIALMLDRADNIRQLKLSAEQPKVKKYYSIPPISKRRAHQLMQEMENKTDTDLDKWFDYMCTSFQPICANCGMEAMWLLNPKYSVIWRACQAHILPKRRADKGGFPSLACNVDNHLVLFPSFGGYLCGCHNLYDSSWSNAKKMDIWPLVSEIFKDKLYHRIPASEVKNIPDELLVVL